MNASQESKIQKFSQRSSLVTALSSQIGQLLEKGIRRSGQASLAVSGGSTPVELFESLSELEIPWKKVRITLVDERWVDPAHLDSNERLVRNHLLKNRAAEALFVGMTNEAPSARLGAEAYSLELKKTIPLPFDVLVLGMGNDGHTASLFPGSAQLEAATAMDSGQLCMACTPPHADHERLTLTLPTILNSRQVILHIHGEKKEKVLQDALKEGPAREMPIRFILRQQHSPLTVFWAP